MNLLTATLFLKEIKRIASLPDDKALAEIDTLLKLLKPDDTPLESNAESDDEDERFAREEAVNDLKNFEDEIAKAKRALTKSVTSNSTAENLRDTTDTLGEYWDSKELKAEFADKISQLKSSAEEVADELDRAYLLYLLGCFSRIGHQRTS